MTLLGSSAGVALANVYPKARSVGQRLRDGWYVAVAYVAEFMALRPILGFHAGSTSRGSAAPPPPAAAVEK